MANNLNTSVPGMTPTPYNPQPTPSVNGNQTSPNSLSPAIKAAMPKPPASNNLVKSPNMSPLIVATPKKAISDVNKIHQSVNNDLGDLYNRAANPLPPSQITQAQSKQLPLKQALEANGHPTSLAYRSALAKIAGIDNYNQSQEHNARIATLVGQVAMKNANPQANLKAAILSKIGNNHSSRNDICSSHRSCYFNASNICSCDSSNFRSSDHFIQP